jgi:hypothetical protein
MGHLVQPDLPESRERMRARQGRALRKGAVKRDASLCSALKGSLLNSSITRVSSLDLFSPKATPSHKRLISQAQADVLGFLAKHKDLLHFKASSEAPLARN